MPREVDDTTTIWRSIRVEHKGFTIWFTGLSGAGKSTIAEILIERLRDREIKTELLDGAFGPLQPLRFFSGHGTRDRAVNPEPARERVEEMKAAGLDVTHREYACGHRVRPEMIDDVIDWIRSACPDAP